MKIIIKSIIVFLLLGCLLPMPYGYFQFVRVAVFAGFIYLSYSEFEANHTIQGVICAGLAILFNPIFKVYLKRPVWNTIDLWLAILLVVWIISEFAYRKATNKS